LPARKAEALLARAAASALERGAHAGFAFGRCPPPADAALLDGGNYIAVIRRYRDCGGLLKRELGTA
jgi:hypothetical protein